LRAHAIKSNLEAARIPAVLSHDSASLLFGITVDGIGQVRVLARPEHVEEARKLLGEQPPNDAEAQRSE